MEIPRISKEELRDRLQDPATSVIDVRQERNEAHLKIPGAVLRDPDRVESWAGEFGKNRRLVLYCS